MSAGEFDGRPLVAGSMVGLRSFRVDGDGRLTGVVKQRVFKPGDNTAVCAVGMLDVMNSAMARLGAPVVAASQAKVSASHHIAGLGCTCGYYAYYTDEANPNHVAGTVEAVIEGWGTVTTGSKGFRAEKAKLVALIEPRIPWWERLARRVLWSRRVVVALAATGFAEATVGAGMLDTAYFLTAVTALVVGTVTLTGALVWDVSGDYRQSDPIPWWLVVRNYPDVPVYRTRRAALRAHPLTVPIPPDPQSDPEFWTRDA